MAFNQVHDLPDGVRSIYLRHKGIAGDGAAMANELAGILESSFAMAPPSPAIPLCREYIERNPSSYKLAVGSARG